jgi:glutaredoxin
MNLKLYYYDQCPYCQFVLRKINSLGLKSIEMRNTLESSEYKSEHNKKTGRNSVPCLYIDEKPMFESADINAWLENNKDKLE